jgi:hypothetical protein
MSVGVRCIGDGPGDRFAEATPMPPDTEVPVTLPLWFSLSISTSSLFSGMTISSTCVSLASLQLGIAGRESSLTGLLEVSKVANWGLSGTGARAGAGLNVGAACERYCWWTGRLSMDGGAIGGW